MYIRKDSRYLNQVRPTKIKRGFLAFAQGSALIEMGRTKVICAATVEDGVPPFLKNAGVGWLTAEYSMLPCSSETRIPRETTGAKGRSQEIQRLIGRALRAVVDTDVIGAKTIKVDCDVLQADGGTRCASITGAWIAVWDAVKKMIGSGQFAVNPILDQIAAVSVGIVDGSACLDLSYEEDSNAETDTNIVMTGSGDIVEIQGTAERKPFTKAQLDEMFSLGELGIEELLEIQREVLGKDFKLNTSV